MNHRAAAAKLYQAVESGRCAGPTPHNTTCPETAAPAVAGRCQACQERFNAYRKQIRQARKAAGLCTNCGEGDSRTRAGRVHCWACNEAQRKATKRRYAKARDERLWALLGSLRGRRQEWAFWVLRQLGYELDERTWVVRDAPRPMYPTYELPPGTVLRPGNNGAFRVAAVDPCSTGYTIRLERA